MFIASQALRLVPTVPSSTYKTLQTKFGNALKHQPLQLLRFNSGWKVPVVL